MSKEIQLKKLTPDATIAQIISADEESRRLLESIGLKPSQNSDETLRAACKQRQWSEIEVLQWLKKNRRTASGQTKKNGEQSKPDFGDNLIKWKSYLSEQVLSSNRELLDEIASGFPRVLKIHGNQYEWLKYMKEHFEHFSEKLRMYYTFETKKFYPLITKLEGSSQQTLDGTVGELKHCRNIIIEDQEKLMETMQNLRARGNGFESPEGACSTLRIMNQNFKSLFEQLEYQFKIERDRILPEIKQRLQSLS